MSDRDASVFGWTDLIDVDPDGLIAMANQRAADLNLTLSPNDHRNVINMLRHDYTYYDGQVRNARSDGLYGEILDAIAHDFPWLAGQCERDKTDHPQRIPLWAQARRHAHSDAQERMRGAREIAKRLSVGDMVTVSWRGPRQAEVIEIRRSRVKLAFTLPNGSRRIIDRSADEVQPH
jgi:hypothetical protein